MDRPRRFTELPRLPRELRIPPWLGAGIGAAVAGGGLLGVAGRGAPPPERLVRSIFYGSAFGYLTTSLLDFWEHFRLERAVTGHYLRCAAVPIGETLNHGATIATLVSLLALARPPRRSLRDLWVLAAPGVFLALGWRDELVYHRRRSTHREDIMHTVAHLAGGVMLASFYTMRLVSWHKLV
jgi:hypothetical protein